MALLPDLPTVALARFKVLDGASGNAPRQFDLQFNPASLEHTLSNEFDDRNGNNGARQFVKKSSAKLTMTLLFDTTLDGSSVRNLTNQVSRLLEPARSGGKKFAPKVEFGWGAYSFKGVVEQYKETIDFFSATGVPLRASIALTLASQDVEFSSTPQAAPERNAPPDPVDAPPGTAPNQAANAMGQPRAARDIAAANGADSLRFGGSAGLAVGGGVTRAAAASFSAGASAGAGIGGGIGGGISAGAGLGLGGGLRLGASAGIGAGAGFGATAGAGISATAGAAFGGLRASPPAISASLADARAALLPAPVISAATSFGSGGRAQVVAGGSLSADVGANADLHARIDFGV